MSKFDNNQNPKAPEARLGAVGTIRFIPKSYGIEFVDFSELKINDHFHFYFNHLPQNEVYKVVELGIHDISVKMVLGSGNTRCPFLGYGSTRGQQNFTEHPPFKEGSISRPSAPVLVIKIKHPNE